MNKIVRSGLEGGHGVVGKSIATLTVQGLAKLAVPRIAE